LEIYQIRAAVTVDVNGGGGVRVGVARGAEVLIAALGGVYKMTHPSNREISRNRGSE
jgi:hypothetical protein